MPCVYKITSPSNKIYIGQTVNLRKRINKYKANDCKNQTRLYRSILKYGWSNHKLEVIEFCNENELNEKERYYQDLFKVCNRNGLNCRLTKTNDKSGSISEESKSKMYKFKSGNNNSNATILINIETGIFYESLIEASNTLDINYKTLQCYLSGKRTNKTNLIYA